MNVAEIPIELISREDLAKRLLKTERTIYNWTRSGKIPHLKVGRSTLYSWHHVLKTLRNNSN
jgi:excisionase family DNA binding protein